MLFTNSAFSALIASGIISLPYTCPALAVNTNEFSGEINLNATAICAKLFERLANPILNSALTPVSVSLI